MRKLLSGFVSVFVLIAGSVIPLEEALAAGAPVSAVSVVLMDGTTHRLLYGKNFNSKRAPASTTKVLTALVVVEHMDLNTVVTVPESVESVEPSKIHLAGGERYRVRDLLRATLINSANDAAETLAVAAGGSRAGFAQMMNEKARSIGCKNSHFLRASGLPAEDQYSTALDMALIMSAAQRNTFILETMKMKTTTIESLSGRQIALKNHNKMLLRGSTEVIGKTGWTRNAKHCFVGQIKLFDRTAVIAMLGSKALWRDLRTLLNYGSRLVKKNRSLGLGPAAVFDAKRVQRALKQAGFYSGDVDGIMGPQTKNAVKKFQQSEGLRADGQAGPETQKALSRFW
ncbi:MAG: peptidoglycan-binding protein [Candidatus Omnitrophota bacterium]